MGSRALRLYKRWLSPWLHAISGLSGACRYQPTCSEYATLALHVHGPARGAWLALRRILCCNPLCRGGFDPVPGTWPPASSPDGTALHQSQRPLHLP